MGWVAYKTKLPLITVGCALGILLACLIIDVLQGMLMAFVEKGWQILL